MNPIDEFHKACALEIQEQGRNGELKDMAAAWLAHPALKRYPYHFTWLGRPIIQQPQDIIAMQELLWKVQPDLLIETGIAHGGSLIFYASILELIAICGGPKNFKVLGIDVEIRKHNLEAIKNHPIYQRGHISMLEGSSIDAGIIRQVKSIAADYGKVMLVLDSNHTHAHVLAELEAYANLTASGSYCVVFDSFVENMPEDAYPDRPWGKGDNPATAVKEFLEKNHHFQADTEVDDKLLISAAPGTYLKRL